MSGVLVISLDFELHWGVRDKRSVATYRENLLGARRAVPAMLAMFTEFGVRATWAIVGLLLTESRREILERMPARRARYRRPDLSPYEMLAEVGENERDDPYHFASSLVRRIAASRGQEIGTHTFGHYYSLEDGVGPDDLSDDLGAAIAITRDKLGRTPRSIAFPRNQFDDDAVAVCGALGLVAYRGNPRGWAYRARRDGDESPIRRAVRLLDAYAPITGSHVRPPCANGARRPLDVAATRYLRPYTTRLRHLEPLRLRRLRREMHRAARDGLLCHFWWHPHDFGRHLAENLAVLAQLLTCFRDLRERHGMESLTMGEVSDRMGA
jgi:peptidoglycan/xylan/chitin deacetylase (PgdA/CDA1 family)